MMKSCNKIQERNSRRFSLTSHLQCKNLRQKTERHFVTLLVFNFVFKNKIEVSLGQLGMQKPPKETPGQGYIRGLLTFVLERLYTRTQPLISGGCSVHYWVLCTINKRSFFEIAFVLTHICLAMRRLLTFCLTLTR